MIMRQQEDNKDYDEEDDEDEDDDDETGQSLKLYKTAKL